MILNALWTRVCAWATKWARGERFEIRFVFDEEKAKTGKDLTTAGIKLAGDGRSMSYAVAHGEDIVIHSFRRADSDKRHVVVRKGNDILQKDGTWSNCESMRCAVDPFESLLEACHGILGDEARLLSTPTSPRCAGDEICQPSAFAG